MIKIKVEINEIENSKTAVKMKPYLFSEMVNKVDKLARLSKDKIKKTRITNIRDGRGGITADPTDAKRKKDCRKQFYSPKLNN